MNGFGWENLRNLIRAVFGGGADISVANPLPTTDVPASPPHSALCSDTTIPAGTTYYVSSGDVWGVLALTIEAGAELRIDGEVHCWDDVNGAGIITGEGELRLH
ncbi:hypothetical protein ES703_46344 [subsurface metagenome]